MNLRYVRHTPDQLKHITSTRSATHHPTTRASARTLTLTLTLTHSLTPTTLSLSQTIKKALEMYRMKSIEITEETALLYVKACCRVRVPCQVGVPYPSYSSYLYPPHFTSPHPLIHLPIPPLPPHSLLHLPIPPLPPHPFDQRIHPPPGPGGVNGYEHAYRPVG